MKQKSGVEAAMVIGSLGVNTTWLGSVLVPCPLEKVTIPELPTQSVVIVESP